MIDNYLFPFSNVSDEDLLNVFDIDETFRVEINESFDPLSVQDNSYNNDIDVNQFYIRSRHIDFPKSEYTYLEKFSSSCSNSDFNLLALNIRFNSSSLCLFRILNI